MAKPQGRSSRAYCLQQESALRRLSDFDGFTPRERIVLLNLAVGWAERAARLLGVRRQVQR